MTSIVWQHPERWWIAVAWLAVVSVFLIIGYARSSLRGWKRVAAMLCKTLAAVVLALCVLDPVRITETPKKGANEVIVLADNSASLGIAESPSAPPRSEALKAAVSKDGKAWSPWMEKLRETFRVRLQAVDERMRGIGDASSLDFAGRQSGLASAVMASRDRRASSVAAVVLISDGGATDAASWKAEPGGAPLYTLMVGDHAPDRDVSLVEVSAQQTTFEDSPVSISAKVAQTGLDGKNVELKVLDEAGKVVQTEKHLFGGSQKSYVFRLRMAVAKPGVSFFKVVAACAEKEATLANNERAIAVDRGTGPYRILYVAGRPNWDHKFLRRALAMDAEVQLPSLIRIAKREPKFDFRSRAGETSNPLFRGFGGEQQSDAQRYDQPVLTRLGTKDKVELADGFPKTPELLMAEYRAIILDDVEADFFTQDQMNLIEKFVSQRGGSVLMLGGADSFAAGGYNNTPVGRMLPVYLDRQGTVEAVQDAKLTMTREGWLEPWTRLRAEQPEDEQRIAAMPGFWSVNQSTSIKPGATVLAMVTDAMERRFPALVTQRYGTGRTVAMTVGDLWRWGLKDKEQHADMDKAWRQLMRWLVTDVPDRIEMEVKLSQIASQDVARLSVRVRDVAFRTQDDASVQFEVTAPGEKPVVLFAEPSLKEPGLFEAEHYPRVAGGYRVKAVVKDAQSKVLGEKATGFALNPTADEMASLAPNAEWMKRLASETGGQFMPVKDASKLADLLPKLAMPQMDRKAQPLWHNAWWLMAMVLLLAGEWAIRRSGGVI